MKEISAISSVKSLVSVISSALYAFARKTGRPITVPTMATASRISNMAMGTFMLNTASFFPLRE